MRLSLLLIFGLSSVLLLARTGSCEEYDYHDYDYTSEEGNDEGNQAIEETEEESSDAPGPLTSPKPNKGKLGQKKRPKQIKIRPKKPKTKSKQQSKPKQQAKQVKKRPQPLKQVNKRG